MRRQRLRGQGGRKAITGSASFLLLWLLGSARAQPAALPVDLSWHAEAACSSRQEVLAEVERMMAGTRTAPVPVAARVDVEGPDGGLWRAKLTIEARGGRNERQIEAITCGEITDVVAVIIAVAVDGGPTAVPPSSVAGSVVGPAAAPGADEVGRASAAGSLSSTSRLIATGAVLVDDGTMPDAPAPGVELALGWTGTAGRVRLRSLLGFGYFPTQRILEAETGRGGTFRQAAVSARLCGSLVRGRFDLGPCLGAEVERMTAVGLGPAGTFVSFTGSASWASATAGLAASWRFSRGVVLFVRAEGLVPFGRTAFVLEGGGGAVHRTSSVAGRAAFGLELRFL